MGTNSIRAGLDKESAISEITLFLGYPDNKNSVIVVVEGEDDVRFLNKMLHDSVTILESYSGKQGVLEIVDVFFRDNIRIIGIRDRDYEQIKASHKIFYYDFCCMEMMLIHNLTAFSGAFSEYYIPRFDPQKWRNELLKKLYFLSMIRSKNEINQWGLALNGLSIPKALINDHIDSAIIIMQIRECNPRIFSDYNEEILDISSRSNETPDYVHLLNITNGHDFSILYAFLYTMYHGKGISKQNVETSLRCSFRQEEFMRTDLYRKIVNYQQETRLTVLA